MKLITSLFLAVLSALMMLPDSAAADAAKEKAFIDTYKSAYEKQDAETLKSLLYTKGADPEILEFYTLMMTPEEGSKITTIELRDLTDEDRKKAAEIQPLPSGQDAKLTLTPIKKLVIKMAQSSANGSSTSSSETFVAEADGKLVIPVPGPVK